MTERSAGSSRQTLTPGRVLRRLRSSVAVEGLVATIGLIGKNAVHACRTWLDGRFDRRYGTDTGSRIELDGLSVTGENRQHGVYYEATPTRIFEFVLDNLNIEHERFEFVDLGSGKGRVLLLASRRPFRRVTGVEFSSELAATAAANIEAFRRRVPGCAPTRSVHGDATQFEWPDGNLCVYAYNPFDEHVMTAVLRNLVDAMSSAHRRVVLVYYNPRPWIMGSFPELVLQGEIRLPREPSRAIQRRVLVYANFHVVPTRHWIASAH